MIENKNSNNAEKTVQDQDMIDERKAILKAYVKAILALILGIAIFLFLLLGLPYQSLICGIIGVILSIRTKKTINADYKKIKGIALAGFVCSTIGLLIVVALIIKAIFFPSEGELIYVSHLF